MIGSLRAQLFAGLTVVIVVTGALGGLFAYRWAYDEAIELQDATLIQTGRFAQDAGISISPPASGVDPDTELTLIELGAVPRGSADDRKLWGFADGLHNAVYGGLPIRVLLQTRGNNSRFAIAQHTSIRDETARGMALRTLLPILALIPCLMLVTGFVITRALRPMTRMARELDHRAADDVTPLSLGDMPGELRPFVVSINGLFERIKGLMSQQRRFIADAAHELRTPITALSLQADNLDPVDLPDAARERIATLKQGMRRTRRLLDQLLTLARHDGGGTRVFGTVALDKIAKEVVADVLPEAARQNIDLGFDVVSAVTVSGDPVMLGSVMRNLADNALRYTPSGGWIDLSIFEDRDSAVLRIEDSGPGIAPDDLARIFEPFYRGQNPVGDGSGLGLSIVQRIVTQSNGTILLENVASTAGRTGLRATVRLPVRREQPA